MMLRSHIKSATLRTECCRAGDVAFIRFKYDKWRYFTIKYADKAGDDAFIKMADYS